MSDEKMTKEPRLEPCDCIPCPDCGGAGWYAQQVSDTEQEQRQCGTCDYKGRVRTPPESGKLVPLDFNKAMDVLNEYRDDLGNFNITEGMLAICQRFGTTKNRDKGEK